MRFVYMSLLFLACSPAPTRSDDVAVEPDVTGDVDGGDAREDGGDGEVVASCRAKLDLLFVIDDSSSMTASQAALDAAFTRFAGTLGERDIDLHVAVTTTSTRCPDDPTAVASGGRFNTVPTRTATPNDAETVVHECRSDDDCAGLDCSLYAVCDTEPSAWRCRTQDEACIVNQNGSVNTTCRRTCTNDEECAQVFGDVSYRCLKPSSNPNNASCVWQPPPDCPAVVPAVLDGSQLDLLRCSALVGSQTRECSPYPEPLRAAWLALDRDGPNAAQAAGFLRPDARLIIAIVSDEDDCSSECVDCVHDDACELLATTDEGGPLTPVATFVERLRGLKADPSEVAAVVLAGDSRRASEAEREQERAAYRDSHASGERCASMTHICLGPGADPTSDGARLRAFGQGFEATGAFVNVCVEGSGTEWFERIEAGMPTSTCD